MIQILFLMSAGVIIGIFMRGKKKFLNHLEKAIMWSIYLLLLLLGISIGSNKVIMASLPGLGLSALMITLGGLAGSILLAALLWKFLFSKKT